MSDQTPPNSSPPGATPDPSKLVAVSMLVTMTMDGNIHVTPGPNSPRAITHEDVYAFANRMRRDVETHMLARTIVNQVSAMANSSLAEAQKMAQEKLAEQQEAAGAAKS